MTEGGAENPPDRGCRHYWIIQPATGPVSQGLCQNCGQTREFKNYVEAATWGDEHRQYRAQKQVAVRHEDEEEWEDEGDFDPDDREIALAL